MSIVHPLALLMLLLLIPVGLIYWLRLRVPRVVVGTVPFWQQALAEEPMRARWQRWRTPVSLALHVLTVILLALAAAGPAIPSPQRIVLILDNSATMRATDVQPSRFEAAKEAARGMIKSLRWCDEMAIVTTSPIPREVQPFTGNQSILRNTVHGIEVDAGPPAIDWAIQMARTIVNSQTSPERIVLITDASVRGEARSAQASGVEVVRVGESADNRAITRFTARRSKVEPAKYQVFVELQNESDRSAQGKLELYIDGKPYQATPFALGKDGHWQHVFELMLPKFPNSAQLTARITPEDAYPPDDVAQLDVPAAPSNDIIGQTILGDVQRAEIRTLADIGEDVLTVYFAPAGTPLWIPLAAVAALLLVLEWCLYQRRWTS